MKYNVNNLYFAKCRHYVMDIVNVTDEKGQIMSSHPDYVDYYTVLLLRSNKYVNIYDKSIKYIDMSQSDNKQDLYYNDLIIEMDSLRDYVDNKQKRVSSKECEFIGAIIQKTRSLNSLCGRSHN